MTEDFRATVDISESFSLQNHHWSFEQFHISFKKSESAPPAVFEGDGSTCLLIICLDGEVHLNLAQPGTCKDMRIARKIRKKSFYLQSGYSQRKIIVRTK